MVGVLVAVLVGVLVGVSVGGTQSLALPVGTFGYSAGTGPITKSPWPH